MSDKMLVATRGLLTLARDNGAWRIVRTDFSASRSLRCCATSATAGFMRCSHGHFGTKPHRSDDDGAIWQSCRRHLSGGCRAARRCSTGTLEAGGADGRAAVGRCITGGLFKSDDRGESWQLVCVWNVPEREKWAGGGYDDAGIHTISPDPRDADRIFVAISCGGVWDSCDAGKSWALHGEGLVATYMPPELAGTRESQDPHRVARCAAAPDTMWMQHHCGIFADRCRRHLDAAQTAATISASRWRHQRSVDRVVCACGQDECGCRAMGPSR